LQHNLRCAAEQLAAQELAAQKAAAQAQPVTPHTAADGAASSAPNKKPPASAVEPSPASPKAVKKTA